MTDTAPQMPEGVDGITWANIGRLGVHRESGALYWDGKEVVTRSRVRLGTVERWMALFATIGAFGSFAVELWKVWHP